MVKFLQSTLLLFLLLTACSPVAPPAQNPKTDPTARIAILSAFDKELEKLRASAKITGSYTLNGRTVWVGRLAEKDVLLTLTGTSMVNSALATQAVFDHFNVSALLFSGIAGGVNPQLNIGDVVVPARWGEYQEQVFAREVTGGWDTGWHGRDYGNFGMMFPQKVSVVRTGAPDQEESRFWFEADPRLLEIARQSATRVEMSQCSLVVNCLKTRPRVIVGGNGVSGPTFVDNAAYREWVWNTFQAEALDMETAAAAHAAYILGIPFLAFRSLSDLAGGGAGKNELLTFATLAAENSSTVLLEFLKNW